MYDDKCAELVQLQETHSKLVSEHDTYCGEISLHVEPVCQKIHDLLVDFGTPPAPYNIKEMYIGQVFQWLSNSIGSLASAGRSFGELGAAVSARTLAHSVCSLLKPSSSGGEPSVSKSDLCLLRDPNYSWPPAEMPVDQIPALPKNIAKNFMQNFFKKFGYSLTVAEGRRVLRKVAFFFFSFFYSYFAYYYYYIYLFFLCFL